MSVTGVERVPSPEPARRRRPGPAGETRAPDPRAAQRRRRERHFRQRRRDLLQDAGIALLATIILISVTAGLGILAIVIAPVIAGLAGRQLALRVARHGAARPGRPYRSR